MSGKNENTEKPIIQSNGYNGSEPTRICPNCGQEKPLSDFGFRNMGNGEIRINHGVKIADNSKISPWECIFNRVNGINS